MTRRVRRAPEGFRYVMASPKEAEAYKSRTGHYPPGCVPRVACMSCGLEMWGAGIAIGSHRRACTSL